MIIHTNRGEKSPPDLSAMIEQQHSTDSRPKQKKEFHIMDSKRMATAAVIFAVFAVAAVAVFPAAAAGTERVADWDGWTYDQSVYERFSPEWVEDVQAHIIEYHYDYSKSDEWRSMSQEYVLGWDDRIGYAFSDGDINWDTGEITYDWGFWGNLFGWGVPSPLFTTVDELNYFMNIYSENYTACHISIFDDELPEDIPLKE